MSAIFFTFLFFAHLSDLDTGEVVPLLLAAQAGLAAFLLVMRRKAKQPSHPVMALIAWMCTVLPFAFDLRSADVRFSIPGLLLALWSLVSLGSAFSIPPEDRGLVVRGPYRFLRHPMYLGEFLSLFGICLSIPAVWWNWLLLLVFLRLIVLRIHAEERVLEEYLKYQNTVRWRMLPWIW